MNILITTAGWKGALTCMRSLAKKGHSISLVSSDQYAPSLYSKFCKEKIISPKERDKEAYLKFLLPFIKEKKYDLLIPMSDLCIEYFSQIQDDLSKYVKILLPPKESIDITLNKDKTYRFASQNGVAIPDTYFPGSIPEVEIIANKITYPCVVKKPKGSSGSGNTYIEKKEYLVTFFSKLPENGPWPVVQEFITSPSSSFTAVCKEGQILDFFMYQRIRQYPEIGGITVFAKSVFDEQALEASSLLLKKLSWNGPMSLDYFIIKDKGFVLSEINSRFSGLIQFAYACGVDLPSKLFELIFEKNIRPTEKRYKTGIYYRSIFPEEIDSCLENKKYISCFFINFLRPNTKYDFSIFDPNLLLWQIKNARWSIFV